MGWKHEMARAMKGAGKGGAPVWFQGEVLSPVKIEEHVYEGPLVISCFDGQVMLRQAQLMQLAGAAEDAGEERLHDGMSVALLGDPFSGNPGALKILILGVVGNAV